MYKEINCCCKRQDDAQFRKTLTETLQESNRVFAESQYENSQSITDFGNNFCRSMQILTQTMITQSQS